MKHTVCVITGGGSGIGLATAREMGKEHYIIISGRTVTKLDGAIKELHDLGVEAEAFMCDVSSRESVIALAERAKKIGKISSVIHAAGLSPNMGNAETIMEVNALGTINVNEVFYDYMDDGGCIVDVSSMSAYLLPKLIIPQTCYPLSRQDPERFMKKMMQRINLFPRAMRASIAYGISKNFVIWYAKTDAVKFGRKGLRVLSVSPGSFETPMGEAEKEGVEGYLEYSAIKRAGKVEEIAPLFKMCTDHRLGYLTGVDILCDGGLIASGVGPFQVKKKTHGEK